MDLYEMTVVHRNTADVYHYMFCDYGSARRYSHELNQYKTLLRGYTIRRMRLDKASGCFKRAGVMYHIRWDELNNSNNVTN